MDKYTIDRIIAHYDDELKAYKKLTNEIFLKIETFKKEHPEYSDEKPVEFNDEES